MNNTNAEQGRQRLCLKEGEGESLKSLALVGRTLHICIIIADNLCFHYFNYCNLPSLHIIINGTAFSELNWHQFMRPLGGKEHTHTQCKAFCVSFGRELHSVFTNLNYCARRIMPPSPPGVPLDYGIPLAQFGNYGQNPSDATRPATATATAVQCPKLCNICELRLLRRWRWQWRRRWRLGLGVESSEKLLQRLCALLQYSCPILPFLPGIKFKFMLISQAASTLWPIICRCNVCVCV